MTDDWIRVSKTPRGLVVSDDHRAGLIELSIDDMFRLGSPQAELKRLLAEAPPIELGEDMARLAPIDHQEVWAAGVTYLRSRQARKEESQRDADIYQRVYDAARPELFFKSTAHRVVGHEQPIVIRNDSNWDVPEAELTLAVNASGKIIGYTVGNDVSSRQLEGENPLYLSQAKIWDGCCSLGPWILITDSTPPPTTQIGVRVERGDSVVFEQATRLSEMKRPLAELVEYLFRECTFPDGVFLMTGTGIVPDADMSLRQDDIVSIVIDGIGTLRNPVVRGH